VYGHLLQTKIVENNKLDEDLSKSQIQEFTKIKKVSIYNPLMGIMNSFDTSKFDFKGLVDEFYPLEE
jgi:hypothetical protein